MDRNIALAGSAVILLAVGLAIAFRPPPPPPEDLATRAPEETADYLASRDFERLPEQKEVEVLSELMEDGDRPMRPRELFAGVEEDQREQLRENVRPVMRQVMNARMAEYFALPSAERMAFLDRIIDDGGPMMGRGGPGGGGRPDGDAGGRAEPPEGEPRGPSAERMKERLESSDPAERAQRQEFMKELQARMAERGIEPPPRTR